MLRLLLLFIICAFFVGPANAAVNTADPVSPVKLIFIHHSCGENWLADPDQWEQHQGGGLGQTIMEHNYFVSDTNYGWGPNNIGDSTDIGFWWDWFRGSNRATYMQALYTEYDQHPSAFASEPVYYSRLNQDPGGENSIIMFKSCYPNSNLGGSPSDAATTGSNPLRGQDSYSQYHTVANAKGIYNDLLEYFATRQDKLFIAVTQPPLLQSDTTTPQAANARALTNWLVNDWLDNYSHNNVQVFDFFNVLTSNGGNFSTNDMGQVSGNHHRYYNGAVEHLQTVSSNVAAYPEGGWDSHPSAAGNKKAASEFGSLINIYYHCWQGSGDCPLGSGPQPQKSTDIPAVRSLLLAEDKQTPSEGVLRSSDLVYQGAFAYPTAEEWTYSGQAMAYYPSGDPSGEDDGYPGSLFAGGSMNDETGDLVGEIDIPAPVSADNFASLPTARVLQSLTDITGGIKDNCTYNEECIYRDMDGLAYLPSIDKVIWNLNDWYNTSAYDQDSLGWSDTDLSNAQGAWHIGPRGNEVYHVAKSCDYLFLAPQSFADTHLGGMRLIAGNTRNAGANGGSQGPTLYASAPWNYSPQPNPGQAIDALALLYYRERVNCVWDEWPDINESPTAGQCDFPDYRGNDHWRGGAWIDLNGKAGIIIVGRKGLGDNCYADTECGDACDDSQGYHAYPYQPQMLFYDPQDIVDVISDAVDPWTVLPAETYSLESHFFNPGCASAGAVAYDESRGIVYVAEQEAGPYGETAVHVWKVQ